MLWNIEYLSCHEMVMLTRSGVTGCCAKRAGATAASRASSELSSEEISALMVRNK